MTVNDTVWRSRGPFDLVPKLAVVNAPVLVTRGIADVKPRRGSKFRASGYQNARLVVAEKNRHLAHVERADVFFPAVETFLIGTFPADAKKVEMSAD